MANVYTPPPRTLLEVFENLPEGTLAQLINNQIYMTPAPSNTHQKVLDKINRQLGNFVEQQNLGETRPAPFDVFLNSKNVYQPDIIFITFENISGLQENGFHGAPDLIIEILSPSTRRFDIIEKKDQYELSGVKEYWIVDPVSKIAEGFFLKNNQFVASPAETAKISFKLIDFNLEF